MAQAKKASLQDLTEQERAYLKAKAERVIFLLDASAMPPEVKTSWLTLLPHMTLDQVDRLIAIVEQEIETTYQAAKQYPEDEELVLKLKAAKERYGAKVAEADKKALAALERIEDALPG